MSTPVLSTKLYIPPLRPNHISRPRLIKRLNQGVQLTPGLTLISAPAGFGKTTLVSEWLRQLELGAAWLSLDESDNDPARFLTYLTAALHQIDPTIKQTEPGMFRTLPSTAPSETLLTELINEIVASSTPFVLVLDDYHLIEAQPVHAALTFLLAHLPPPIVGSGGLRRGLHLVLTCRADPPLPLARWRARGQLTELREADLRFTAGEAAVFFNEVSGLNLSSEEVEVLQSRTEGWITGLHLAALSMHHHENSTGFVKAFTGSHRYVLDYLTDEVLSRQPEAVQDFLVRTAVLDRLSGPLCDAVLGRTAQERGFVAKNSTPTLSAAWPSDLPASSQEILEYLEAANLFLLPLDNERRWYRYHHLFADLLRHRLRQNLAEQIPTLHQRASAWYEQHDLPVEAVDHALAAGAFERAASLVEQMGWEMLTRGEMVILLTWLERLPGALVRSRTQLQIFRAWALALTGRLESAEAQLQEIDAEVLPGEVAAVRAYVAFLQQDSRAPALARRALDLLPEQNFTLRSMMALSLGTAIYWSLGEPVAAGQSLAEAVRLARASEDNHLVLAATSTLGFTQEMRGQLHQAAETHRQALQLTAGAALPGDRRRSPPFAGLAHLGLAGLLYEWNDLDGAQHHAREGIALGERSQSVDVLQGGGSYLIMAQIDQARGEEDKALALIRQAKQFAQIHNQAYVVALSAAIRSRLWLAQGQVAAASRWARDRGLHPDDELSYARETEYITLARLLAAQGQTGEALGLLARLLAAAQAAERTGSALKILVVTALTLQTHRAAERAISTLDQALTLAEPEGYVRTFVDEGAPMAKLLRQALSEGIRPDYVARLLAAFSQEARLSFSARDSLREPLTERELEVLRLVTAGLSNSEIAEELVIAVSTVKSHINHIFGKLEVESRTQAVAKAQKLGML